MSDDTLYFDFHGILVKVVSKDKETASCIESDFSYFRIDPPDDNRTPGITIFAFFSKPPYEKVPEATLATCNTKDEVIYKSGDIRYFDSFGRALIIYDYRYGSAEIYSFDRDLLHEKCYLLIMSRVAELLDQKRLHRIHAMGVAFDGKAVLCLMPMGGGKTTLALSLLENKSFSLLSDEIPLVSSGGLCYPFPIRMGVVEQTPLSIPKHYLKRFKRRHYSPKVLINLKYFEGQIAKVAQPGLIFVGKRIHSRSPAILRIPRPKAFLALFRLCVVGVGLPQALEYLLRFDISDIMRQSRIFFSRFLACLKIIQRSQTYELHLGYDTKVNASVMAQFILGINRDCEHSDRK
jgi:hypothetical protein